jgi:hypothetical protein
MRLISCASYFGSGSSALTDLVSEYQGVKSLTDYEFRFVHDIDGIADLEYHLVDCHNRHNSGHALKRFWKLCQFNHGTGFIQRYEPFFGGHYLELSREYVESLTDFEYKAYWFNDWYDRGRLFYYTKSLQGKVYKMLGLKRSVMPNEITLASHPTRERFLRETRKYISNLLYAANPNDEPYLMLDQILPSSNVNKCLRYFPDDTKLVIVTRDPRDVFLSEKFVWRYDILPHDPELFCKWFDYTHKSNLGETPDTNKVITINFEDLIYNYDEMVLKLERFLDLNPMDHVHPYSSFNPKRSIGNTQLWKKYNDVESIRIIEKMLPDYLYDFDSVCKNEIAGFEPSENAVF